MNRYLIRVPTGNLPLVEAREYCVNICKKFKEFLPEDRILVVPDSIKIHNMGEHPEEGVKGDVGIKCDIANDVEVAGGTHEKVLPFIFDGNLRICHPIDGDVIFSPTPAQQCFFDAIDSDRQYTFLHSSRQIGMSSTLTAMATSIAINVPNQNILFSYNKHAESYWSRDFIRRNLERFQNTLELDRIIEGNPYPSMRTNNKNHISLSNGTNIYFESIGGGSKVVKGVKYDYAFLDNASFMLERYYSEVLEALRSDKVVVAGTAVGGNSLFHKTILTGRLNGKYNNPGVEVCKLNFADAAALNGEVTPQKWRYNREMLGDDKFFSEFMLADLPS